MTKPKRHLDLRGKQERAAEAKAANKREAGIAKAYLKAGPSIINLAKAAYHWYNSVPMLGGQNESGLDLQTGEAPNPGMRSPKAIAQGIKTITKANAAKATAKEWDDAYNAAINTGNIAEAQRLRDLHFIAKTPKNKLRGHGERPMPYFHTNKSGEKFNIIDLNKSGQNWKESKRFNRNAFYLSPEYYDRYWGDNIAVKSYVNAENPKYLRRIRYPTEDEIKSIKYGDYDVIAQPINAKDYVPEYDTYYRMMRGKSFPKEGLYSTDEYPNILNNPAYKERIGRMWDDYNPKYSMDVPAKPITEVVVFDPTKVKSAYPITRDNAGNIIPLSQRDNFNINDIRYGLAPIIGGGIGYTVGRRYLDEQRPQQRSGGSIHIAPSKKGTFTAAATKHGMGVQEFAARVLRNKSNYSPSLVKKANFARNASKWNH